MNAANLARTILGLFNLWQEAKREGDEKVVQGTVAEMDRLTADAVELVQQTGGPGSGAHRVLANALEPVREAIVPIAERLTQAGWPEGIESRPY